MNLILIDFKLFSLNEWLVIIIILIFVNKWLNNSLLILSLNDWLSGLYNGISICITLDRHTLINNINLNINFIFVFF